MTEHSPHDLDAFSRSRIGENLARVRAEVAEACRLAGRDATGVRIVGVTKYVGTAATQALAEMGLVDLGESRPQALWEKAAVLRQRGGAVRWHLVGHLQRNKVRRTLPEVHVVHSLDSLRLIKALAVEAAASGHMVDALLEVNLAAAPGRTGFRPEDLPTALDVCGGLRIRGLMGMASAPEAGREASSAARAEFARLRETAERLRAIHPAAASLTELSMGMSGDFREAILEGSTLVRIGSSLWEGVAGG
jgi:pyridoxal phosphate enzyme (YggS family)